MCDKCDCIDTRHFIENGDIYINRKTNTFGLKIDFSCDYCGDDCQKDIIITHCPWCGEKCKW